MDISFAGKRALVTGAGKGIGRATALALARCGAKVTAVTRTQADLHSLLQECASITPVCVDLADWGATEAALQDVGPIDLLVNNAACATLQPFLEVTSDKFDQSFDVNVKAVLHVSQMVGRGMRARGSGGSIVNVSSQVSQRALREHAVYCASKAALDMLTKVMALELGPYQIRVNSVNPTVVMTDMGRLGWSDLEKSKTMMSRIPLGRFAELFTCGDCSGKVFLCSWNSTLKPQCCTAVPDRTLLRPNSTWLPYPLSSAALKQSSDGTSQEPWV